MAQGLHGVSRPLPPRHRYLRPRALGLRPRARGVGSRLARRPAGRGRRAHRLEERRGPVRAEEMMRTLTLGFLAAASAAPACELPGGESRAIQSPHYLVLYRTRPAMKVGRHFAIEFAVCPTPERSEERRVGKE